MSQQMSLVNPDSNRQMPPFATAVCKKCSYNLEVNHPWWWEYLACPNCLTDFTH